MREWLASFPKTSLAWLAFIRIGVGLALLSQGLSKLGVTVGGQPGTNWLVNATPLMNTIAGTGQGPGGAINGPTIDPLYRSFLQGVVVPNIGLFATLVTLGEILVGLSLVLGLLTRAGAIGGAFLNLNYMLMKGWLAGGNHFDRVYFLIEITLAVTAAGYVLGLDGLLRASVPAWLRALMSPAPDEAEPVGPARERRVQPA